MGKLNMYDMMTIKEYITEHCHLSMDKAMTAERFPVWKRACDAIDDINFIRHGLLRCLSPSIVVVTICSSQMK
jgi:hypothetical protein